MAREPERGRFRPLQDVAARLEAAGFHLLPAIEIQNHYVVGREEFVALVERRADGGFGQIGAPGLLRDGALAALVWKAAGPVFVVKGREWAATAEEVEGLRRFDAELRRALAADERR